MNAPRPQADSQPRTILFSTDKTDYPANTKFLPAIFLEDYPEYLRQTTSSNSLPPFRRSNESEQLRNLDHPEWFAYLTERHILIPAIAAGAWVEYSDYYGRYCLVWHEKRRDGSRGARRRRFIDPPVIKGVQVRKCIWFSGAKTDEPFHYIGTLDELRRVIADADGELHIVEGEFDVWSMHVKCLPNTVGLYGARSIPPDIASILNELGVKKIIFFADNDKAGKEGASQLRKLLHESGWQGEAEYRKFEGPGIPEKGDANDLLCHHYPDTAAARAALDALPRFEPSIEQQATRKPASVIEYNDDRWGAVKEENRIALGVTHFKANGFSKNIHCPNPHHEDKNPSAALHKGGFCTCQVCGTFNAKQLAEFLDIDWRSLLKSRPQPVSSTGADLNAVPQTAAETAPLAFERAPDSWLRSIIRFCKPIEAVLFLYVIRALNAGTLARRFTRRELLKVLPTLGCNVDKGAIYKVFQEVTKHGNHPLFVKIDSGQGSGSRYCQFALRAPADMKPRLEQRIRYRVYEKKFRERSDILIAFEAFDEALQGSEFTKTLEAALEPLYHEQKPRFDSLINSCEGIIAGHLAELDDLSATTLPDWTIDKPSELPAILARGIYDADPQDRGKAKWAPDLGIGKSSVNATLRRGGIKRTAYTIREEVDSQREAKDKARDLGAKIVAIEVDGSYLAYDAAMVISPGTVVIYQPPAKHEAIGDEKQVVTAPAKARPTAAAESKSERADNMKKPGNWHESSWDPHFIYWELIKACRLLHGYEVIDGIGITNPRTGEVWTNPTVDELVKLIVRELGALPDTS